MKNLQIKQYIVLLFRQGTLWENGVTRSNGINPANKVPFFSKKRLAIIALSVAAAYYLKKGFNDDFTGFLISGLSIFIGLFINIIVVLYQRFISFASVPTAIPNANTQRSEEIKKNFIRQFTFVTGKNLLISTLIIIACTGSLMFQEFFGLDISHLSFISSLANCSLESIQLFGQALVVWAFRLVVLYLLMDFFLLLLYSIGSLFAFLKGEY